MNDSRLADFLFRSHATADTGFGHAARCGQIAAILARRGAGRDLIFEGEFSDGARQWIEQAVPVRFADGAHARVGIYDRMDDAENPSILDPASLMSLRRRCRRVLFIASGVEKPAVPGDVTVVGYTPGGPASEPPRLVWGLEYAPVGSETVRAAHPPREADTAFVALGGAHGPEGLRKTLSALALLPNVRRIEVLDSPVNPLDPNVEWARSDQNLRVHRRAPSVAPFLAAAGVVIASYGNLGYEALALGAPLCLVGQKAFQAAYADRLAARGLCIAAGRLSELDPNTLAAAVQRTLGQAPSLSTAASAAVDGHGLDRIAALIEQQFAEAA